MQFEKVSAALYEYCSENRWLKIVLPMAQIVLYVATVIDIIGLFVSLNVVGTIAWYTILLTLVLCVAKADFKAVAIGLAGQGVQYAYLLIRSLFRLNLNLPYLFHLLVFAGLAFLAYKKSLKMGTPSPNV